MNKIKEVLLSNVVFLSDKDKIEFNAYFPKKVYTTERNISLVVLLTQVVMILLFLSNRNLNLSNLRTVGYISLYIFLLVVTIIAIFIYRYAFNNNHFKMFLWVRRFYCFMICLWLMGITFLDLMKGSDLSVYSYLLPTMAAVLLLSPIESIVIFSLTWVILISSVIMFVDTGSIFGILINSIFVTVLSIFISFRYYRSLAIEFLDGKIIHEQVLEIKSANNQLEEIAHRDQLTGLYNRHYLHQVVYPMFAEYSSKDLHSMCLLLDIDSFKQYNDEYGHLQGDECIKKITTKLIEFCEKYEAIAVRYGGEEFLVIKVSKEQFNAHDLTNEFINDIKNLKILREDTQLGYVTVSAGLWHDQLFKVSSLESAIQHADDALYRAKNNGRNCIVEAKRKN